MNSTIVQSIKSAEPIDTVTFDEEQQPTIDLTEIIDYDKQRKVKTMVSGIESFLVTGKLDNITAMYAGVRTAGMDPTGGSYNSRFGGESFIGTIMDSLEKGITAIIRFIKKILMWCVNAVKQLFGYEKSDRQAAVIKEAMPKLKEEIIGYLTMLGFPVKLINLDNYLGSMAGNKRRSDTITFLVSKFKSEEDYINSLKELPPIIITAMREIGRSAKEAKRRKQRLSKTLDRVAKHANYLSGPSDPDIEQLKSETINVIQALNYSAIIPSLEKLHTAILGTDLKREDDFAKMSINMAEGVSACLKQAKVNASSEFVAKVEQILSVSYAKELEAVDNEFKDIRSVAADLNDVAQLDDLEKIKLVCTGAGTQLPMTFFSEMTNAVNAYTNFAKVSLDVLRLANNSYNDLSKWYSDSVKFMCAMLVSDVETVSKMVLAKQAEHAAAKKPFPIEANAVGIPKNLVLMSEADAQTAMEKMATLNQTVIQTNILGIKDALNNFGKESGLGKLM